MYATSCFIFQTQGLFFQFLILTANSMLFAAIVLLIMANREHWQLGTTISAAQRELMTSTISCCELLSKMQSDHCQHPSHRNKQQ